MAFSFEDAKKEIREMALKVPKEYLDKKDTVIQLYSSSILVIRYGMNDCYDKMTKTRDATIQVRYMVYSEESIPLVLMIEDFLEEDYVLRDSPPIRRSPLINLVSALDQDLYHELYG